jgi:hypothetical protein
LASGSEDLSEKDAQDRRQAMMTALTLPTFDDEDDEFSSQVTDARPRGQLSQAAPVLGDDYNADDAVGYGFAVPPYLLQPLPRFRIDLHPPLAVS